MSIKRTIITTIVALALVAVVAPAVTSATTVADLMAQITALQAQLQGLSGTPAATGTGLCAGVTFTRNLTVGSTGSDVKCLQQILSVTPTSGYFGPKTLTAVKAYQTTNGLTAANQVGPMTRAKLNATLGTTAGTPGTPGTPVVTPTGAVSAMVASDSPASGAIVKGQATANLLHVAFVGSGVVTSVTLQRSGISDQNTLTNVYLYDGSTRITDGYSFNVSGQIVINGLAIAVNGSKTISVKADVYAPTTLDASTIAVALTGFTANGAATTANVQGNTMSIVVGNAATATLSANTVTPAASINAGTMGYTFWSAPVQVNVRAVLLKTANFRMIGSAPSDALGNIKMFIDGVDTGKVATVMAINGSNYASFDLTSSPITLTTGSHTIDMRADVQKGTNRTVVVSVQQASDLTIYDPQVGVNIAVGGTVPNSAQQITILTGSVTVVVDPTFTSATNVSSGATNAIIGRFKFHAYGEDIKVSTLNVTPLIGSGTAGGCTTNANGTTAGGTCGINNVTLYFNGSQIGSQTSQTSANMGSTIPFTLGSQMIVPAGQDSILEVRADLQTSGSVAYTAGTVTVTLPAETTNGQGMSSQATVGAPTNAPATTGLSVSSASVALAANTAYANQSISPNTTGVKIGSYVIQNQSTSEAVRLTQLKVVTWIDSANPPTGITDISNLAALRTSDTTGSGSTPIQPTGLDTFSVSDTLAPGASITVDIFADTGSNAVDYVMTKLQVTSIGAVSNTTTYTPGSGTYTTGQTLSLGTGSMSAPTLVVSSTTPAQYVASASGAQNASQAAFNFVSTSGASTITELKFNVTAASTVTKICVGTACGSPVSGVVDLTGLSLAVPNGGGGLTINAQVSYPIVGTSGTAPSTTSLISLAYVKYTAGGTPKAAGTGTQCAAYPAPTCSSLGGSGSDSQVDAKTVTLVGSKPTITVATGGSAGLLLNANNQIGQVTVAADAQGAIKVRQISFAIGYSGFTSFTSIDSPYLSVNGSTVSTAYCTYTPYVVTCAINSTGAAGGTTSYANDYPVSQGGSVTFNLFGTVTGTNTGTSTASISSSVTNSSSVAAQKFLWDDTSTNGNSGTALTGVLINGFPTNSYSVHQ